MSRNVILITIDALRADHLPVYVYHRSTAPFLSEFANNHAWFERAYSASSHTREALPAILTGEYPDIAVEDSWELNTESLVERLSEEPLRAGAFHSNPYASRAYGFDRGFDEFDDDLYLGDSRLLSPLQRGIQKKLKRRRAPLISFQRYSTLSGSTLVVSMERRSPTSPSETTGATG